MGTNYCRFDIYINVILEPLLLLISIGVVLIDKKILKKKLIRE